MFKFIVLYFSTLRRAHIKEKVLEFLKTKKTAFGDFVVKEFQDKLLSQNVEHIALCDVNQPSQDKKVSFEI